MRRIGTIGVAAVATIALAGTVLAASSVDLGTAKSFAVLAGTTITNTGATTITGDVGLSPGAAVTGFSTVTLNGTQHVADAVALQAKNDLVTAYNAAAGATPVTYVPTELGGTTLKPGVYASATLGLTTTLTLDGSGVYIFQAGSTLITGPGSSVNLINGASACDVYWQVGSSATLDTTTSFKGTIMALISITLNSGVTLQGRALARTGAVTMIHDTIDNSSCAAPTPTATPTATPSASPAASASPTASAAPTAAATATPKPGTTPAVTSPAATPPVATAPTATLPATDTLASTRGTTDRTFESFLVLLVIGALAVIVSMRLATTRSARPRD